MRLKVTNYINEGQITTQPMITVNDFEEKIGEINKKIDLLNKKKRRSEWAKSKRSRR